MALPLYYNWRNLLVRKLSTSLTFSVVAAVVFVLAVLLAFAAGIRKSAARSGNDRNLVVLAPGSTSESTSILLANEAPRLVQVPGVARGRNGELLISYEVSVQTSIPRVGPEGNLANVAVRGVDDVAMQIHDDLRISEGRWFQAGALELVVGREAAGRFTGLQIGGKIAMGRLANRVFTVVGIFEAGGSVIESEIWGPRTIIADVYSRNVLSSALVRISDGADVQAAIDYINGAAVNLSARRETDYYKELGSKTNELVFLASVLISIMAIGAIFAVANTLYAAVDSRKREIAMVRTLGFGRLAVVTSFTLESLLICIPACVFGLLASLAVDGAKQDVLSDQTWTVMAYELTITPGIAAVCLILATTVGLLGAAAPAMRAARTRVIEALRKS